MTIKELEQELEQIGVPNEKLCIVREGKWQVYYSERGNKSGLKVFETETEACEFFLRKMKRYATV